MTQEEKGGDSPAGVAAPQHSASAVQHSQEVYGVLVLDLGNLRTARGAPTGVHVRINLANERWIDFVTLTRLDFLTCTAAHVEVIGKHAGAIADVVRYLRKARDRHTITEAEHAESMARWGFGDVA